VKNIFQGKNILITGGTGSIGSEIVRKILQYEPKVVRIFSNDEEGLFSLGQDLLNYPNARFLVGDVRDEERLTMAVEGIDFIFHAAALKHVPLSEYNPFEAVKTNVIGTQNVIEVARRAGVKKLINISTDKAVNPVSVMGATKLLCERLTVSANSYSQMTIFSSVRFGNVIGSRGSVIPFFAEQIKKGGPVTITDDKMTRFVILPDQAINLLFTATAMSKGGEIFILKMPSLKISDLAKAMIDELAPEYGYKPSQIKIKVIGARAREKIHEELITEEEAKHAQETEEMFIVLPHIGSSEFRAAAHSYPGSVPARPTQYTSEESEFLNQEEIKAMLRENFSKHTL
jgi:UDP-N-acetylglucosamine 4,6-dehydratase